MKKKKSNKILYKIFIQLHLHIIFSNRYVIAFIIIQKYNQWEAFPSLYFFLK